MSEAQWGELFEELSSFRKFASNLCGLSTKNRLELLEQFGKLERRISNLQRRGLRDRQHNGNLPTLNKGSHMTISGNKRGDKLNGNNSSDASDKIVTSHSSSSSDDAPDSSERDVDTDDTSHAPDEESSDAEANSHASDDSEEESLDADTNSHTSSNDTRDANSGNKNTSLAFSPFTITLADMGENLIGTVTKLIQNPKFEGKVSITGIDVPDMPAISTLSGTVDYTHIQWRQGPYGYAYLEPSPITKPMAWPDFPSGMAKPTRDEMETRLEDLAEAPPQDPILYYGGTPVPDLCGLLHSGETLQELGSLEFINTTYMHVGGTDSGTAMHCEDGNLWSCNVSFAGLKLWCVVKEHDTKKFEALVWRYVANKQQEDGPTRGRQTCHNFVRHLNLVLAPSWLREKGIDFDLFCAGPGDMVITKPYQYHTCINWTPSLAISTNFLLPGEAFPPEGLRVCNRCGTYPLHREYCSVHAVPDFCLLRNEKRKATNELGSHRKLLRTQSARETEYSGPHYKAPSGMDKDLESMADGIRSTAAIRQFVSLVKAWKAQDVPEPLSGDIHRRLEQRIQKLEKTISHSALSAFEVRLCQLRLTQELQSAKRWRRNVQRKDFDKICQAVQWDKRKLRYQDECGRGWRDICGDWEGILCFLFLDEDNLFGISPSSYTRLQKRKRQRLCDLVDRDYVQALHAAGEAFIRAVETATAVEFAWESKDIDWSSVGKEDLMSYLKVL